MVGLKPLIQRPPYRQALKKRRCLIPVDGFYEWKKVVGGKIPYSIGMKDDSRFVLAGLWVVARIHTRMPVILPEEDHEAWLSNQAGKEVLVPFPADAMRAWPISLRVISPKNNDPEIMASMGALDFYGLLGDRKITIGGKTTL
jgi:putative SOS response-associated peptidase YedK